MSRPEALPGVDPAAVLVDRAAALRRRTTLAVVLIGFAVCGLAGGIVAAEAALGAAAVLYGSWRRARVDGPPSERIEGLWRVLNASAMVVGILAAFAGVPWLIVAVGFVAWLQVHRAFTGQGARDDRVALLLGLLQALLGCILSISPLLALLFAGLAVVAPVAMALCHLGIEAERASAERLPPGATGAARAPWVLGPATVLLTIAFFVVLPRLDGGAGVGAGAGERVTGFGENVDLGDLGELLESDERVMRVRATTLDGGTYGGALYLRGAALDHFDGERWRTTTGGGMGFSEVEAPGSVVVRQEILLEPMSERAVFGMHEVVDVRPAAGSAVQGIGQARLLRDANGTLRYTGDARELEYTVESRLPPEDADLRRAAQPDAAGTARSRSERIAARSGAWLQLPTDLDPRVAALAEQVVEDAGAPSSAWGQALALALHLQTAYTYSLVPPEPPGGVPPADPLAWFLFEGQAGHCEYFATALAVMLRTRGIPTRIVNGFLGGEYNALGDWTVVRQRDAHSWVEVNLGPGLGWVPLDGTPAGGSPSVSRAALLSQALDWLDRGWRDVILEYEVTDQLDALESLGGALAGMAGGLEGPEGSSLLGEQPGRIGGLVLVVALGGLVVLGIRGWLRFLSRAGEGRRRRPGRVEAAWRKARRLLARRDLDPPASLPPVEAAAWVRARAGAGAAPLESLAWMVYRVRYGGEQDGAMAARAQEALAALRRARLSPLPPAAEGGQEGPANPTASD